MRNYIWNVSKFFFARKLHHSCFIWSYIRVCWCWVNLAKIYIFLYKGQPLLSHSINFMNVCTFKTHYFWKTWRYKLFLLCFLGHLKERNWWFNDDCMLFHAYYSVLQIHFFVWRMANLREAVKNAKLTCKAPNENCMFLDLDMARIGSIKGDPLHRKSSFSLRVSSVNLTKSSVSKASGR